MFGIHLRNGKHFQVRTRDSMSSYEILLLITLGLLAFFGFKILERLPRSNTDRAFQFMPSDCSLALKVTHFYEKKFEVSYVDGWNVGRSFALEGEILLPEDQEHLIKHQEIFGFNSKTTIYVYPTADWFSSSTFGYLRKYTALSSECYVGLPYQLANQAASDLTRNPNQIVTIGVRGETDKTGAKVWRVCAFEFEGAN